MSLRIRKLALAAFFAIACGGASVAGSASAAKAAARPLPQHQVRAALPSAPQPWHAVRPGPHVFYGTIAAIRGNIITLRLRNGRPVAVDATAAIANGDYSAPLFVGKVVSVDGNQVGATLTATHIFRLTNLANLHADK